MLYKPSIGFFWDARPDSYPRGEHCYKGRRSNPNPSSIPLIKLGENFPWVKVLCLFLEPFMQIAMCWNTGVQLNSLHSISIIMNHLSSPFVRLNNNLDMIKDHFSLLRLTPHTNFEFSLLDLNSKHSF